MRPKSPRLIDGDVDKTDAMSALVLSGESVESKKKSVENSYEFLKMKLGYSETLALAASGYVPPLD